MNIDKLKNVFAFTVLSGLFFNRDIIPESIRGNYSNFFYVTEMYLLGRIISYEKPTFSLALTSSIMGVASELGQKYNIISGVYDEKDIYAYIIGGISIFLFDKFTKNLESRL